MPEFLKTNPLPGSTSLLDEARGLEEISRHFARHGLRTPRILRAEKEELVLERIDSRTPSRDDWRALAQGLAKLHRVSEDRFGFESDNHIGLNPQSNSFLDHWGEFFCAHRLGFQLSRIQESGLRSELSVRFEKHRATLVNYLNSHSPQASLVHGDLWSGNILFDESGPVLIDPAVYYGDREVDLAMTRMFGGFSEDFYSAYEKEFPLAPGHATRVRIYNLYHYLNHLNLFGRSYLPGVQDGFSAIEAI